MSESNIHAFWDTNIAIYLLSGDEKLAAVFEVDIAEFFKSDDLEQEVNLPLMQKIKMIDTLAVDEQQALLKWLTWL